MSGASGRKSTHLWLIRHGEPAEEVRGRCYGRLDVGLSEAGRRQIERVASRLAAEPLTAIYASPRKRTTESAKIIAATRGCEVRIEQDLREIDFGAFEGIAYDDIATRYPEIYKQWMEHPTEVQFPNGESFSIMRARVGKAFSALIDRHAGECLAVVTHGGVNRVILANILSVPNANVFRIAQGFAAINLIQYIGDYPVVELMNGAG